MKQLFGYITLSFILFGCNSIPDNDSPCILQATADRSSFIFRKDGTFQFTNGSGLGVSQNAGKYTGEGEIITLDKIGFDKVIKSRRLMFTSVQPNSHSKGKYLVQVDEQNNIVDSMFIFSIYIDVRDSIK
ncbi:hypothetical protein [Ferruginibacter albus]|uniref:hypothetical protein n=1 Tax=Ferruginibacter albus TaxID=2875540 RepID=UPI001CC4DBFA|nr:hypothetical protein [Ferruginibacter albus]UAY53436.1 hypothetical protein K9M53_07120 [Ferruginibacter albus]